MPPKNLYKENSTSTRLGDILNLLIESQLGKGHPKVSKFDFGGTHSKLAFRIQFTHIDSDNFSAFCNQFYALFDIEPSQIKNIRHSKTQTSELNFLNSNQILNFFEAMAQNKLLPSPLFLVYLLQDLMLDTIYKVLSKSNISTPPPKSIQFNELGEICAVVNTPENNELKINNTNEMEAFLKQHCSLKLSSQFFNLLRGQQKVALILNAHHDIHNFITTDRHGLALIFAKNHFTSAQLCNTKKTMSISLERRNEQDAPLNPSEKRFFQHCLLLELGASFSVSWHTSSKLIIACNPKRANEFTTVDIEKLKQVLLTCALLTPTEIDSLPFETLLGAPEESIPTIPLSIEEILECKILLQLPEVPVITPTGNSYDQQALEKHFQRQIANYQDDNDDDNYILTEPLSRAPITNAQLRPNLLVKRLIEHYNAVINESTANSADVQAPKLLLDPETHQFYEDPVVLINGETVSRQNTQEKSPYPNRCVAELINHYKTTLVANHSAVIRSDTNATIAANLGLLCPGIGALSEDAARDEAELFLPDVQYDPLISTLTIHFSTQEYARRFELGLKGWQRNNTSRRLNSEDVVKELIQTKKMITDSNGLPREQVFRSSVSVHGDVAIKTLLEQICNLSPTYFNELQALTGTHKLDAINHLIQTEYLDNWKGSGKKISIFSSLSQDIIPSRSHSASFFISQESHQPYSVDDQGARKRPRHK